jgi:hypothetical protein
MPLRMKRVKSARSFSRKKRKGSSWPKLSLIRINRTNLCPPWIG